MSRVSQKLWDSELADTARMPDPGTHSEVLRGLDRLRRPDVWESCTYDERVWAKMSEGLVSRNRFVCGERHDTSRRFGGGP
jgi:hypothetical protein